MDVATISDQGLKDLIAGKSQVEFDFLAAKILLMTLRSRTRLDSSPATLERSVTELKDLFKRFQKQPAVQSDLQKIIVAGGAPAQEEVLFTLQEVSRKIAEGRNLILAGDSALLKQVPAVNWIAGTIPYFMARQ